MILYDLSHDARHNSAADIAEHVRVSAQTVRNRIDQLEENGVIKGDHTQIDVGREGYLTALFLCTTSVKDRARLAHQVLQIPGIVNVRAIVTGRTDLWIVAWVKTRTNCRSPVRSPTSEPRSKRSILVRRVFVDTPDPVMKPGRGRVPRRGFSRP